MPNPRCELCLGSGMVWQVHTLDRWHSDHTGLPPNQWRDLVCACAKNEPPLRRGKKKR